jgi:hypothetical protein
LDVNIQWLMSEGWNNACDHFRLPMQRYNPLEQQADARVFVRRLNPETDPFVLMTAYSLPNKSEHRDVRLPSDIPTNFLHMMGTLVRVTSNRKSYVRYFAKNMLCNFAPNHAKWLEDMTKPRARPRLSHGIWVWQLYLVCLIMSRRLQQGIGQATCKH